LNTPIRQHWVPKVFLKRFAIAGSGKRPAKAWRFDLRTEAVSCPSLGGLAVKRHLYTLKKSLEDDYSIETDFLQRIENGIGPTLDAYANGDDVSTDAEHRSKMATFLATLWLRNPGAIKMQEDFTAAMIQSTTAAPDGTHVTKLDNIETVWSAEEWARFTTVGPDGMRQRFARSIVSLAPEISETLRRKPSWRLARADEGYFFTSDNPLIVKHPEAERWGLGTEGVDITIAISPRYALYLGDRSTTSEGQVLALDKGVVESINYFTLTQAKAFLMSAHPFDDVLDMIQSVKQR